MHFILLINNWNDLKYKTIEIIYSTICSNRLWLVVIKLDVQKKDIGIVSQKKYMLFTDQEVRIKKNFAHGLEWTGWGHRPSAFKTEGKDFLDGTEQGR